MIAKEQIDRKFVRNVVLKYHYDHQDFSVLNKENLMNFISNNMDINHNEIETAYYYLIEEEHLHIITAAGCSKITAKGIKYMEELIEIERLQILKKKQCDRNKILNYFYQKLEGSNSYLVRDQAIKLFIESYEMTLEEVESALSWLTNEHLIEAANYRGVKITPEGVRKVENSIQPLANAQNSLTYIDNKVMGDIINNGDHSPLNNRSEVTNSFNSTTSEPAKIIKEIEQLIEHLEKINPNTTDEEKVNYIKIAAKPELKSRVIAAFKGATDTFIDEYILESKSLKVGKSFILGLIKG
jgi:hypothetical protein